VLAAAVFRAATGTEKPQGSVSTAGSSSEGEPSGGSGETKLEEQGSERKGDLSESDGREKEREVKDKPKEEKQVSDEETDLLDKVPDGALLEASEYQRLEKQILKSDGDDNLSERSDNRLKKKEPVSNEEDVLLDELANDTLKNDDLSEKREGKQEEPRDLKKDEGLSDDIIPGQSRSLEKGQVSSLNDLRFDLLNSLHKRGYSDERIILAIECCIKLARLRPGSEAFVGRVRQSLQTAEKIEGVLKQKDLTCSLEGIFVINHLLAKNEEDCLLQGTELPDSFDKELREVVTTWNLIEPLRNQEYSLEEVSSVLFCSPIMKTLQDGRNLRTPPYQQVKELIDSARHAAELLKGYGYQTFSFKHIFFAIYQMNQLGLSYSLMLESAPEIFCQLMAISIQSMTFVQNTYQAFANKGYTCQELELATQWISITLVMKKLMASFLPNLSSSFTLDASEAENAINTARSLSGLFKEHVQEKSYSLEEILFASNGLRLERRKSLEEFLKEDPTDLCKAVEAKILARKNSVGE